MASKRRNMFYRNKKQETTKIGVREDNGPNGGGAHLDPLSVRHRRGSARESFHPNHPTYLFTTVQDKTAVQIYNDSASALRFSPLHPAERVLGWETFFQQMKESAEKWLPKGEQSSLCETLRWMTPEDLLVRWPGVAPLCRSGRIVSDPKTHISILLSTFIVLAPPSPKWLRMRHLK
ncbi:hypothetical protein AAG570_002809 [Ranatra chinensis]|uniref:Uncharacterized protein n=1 Tax=Ranatra chinensis TaxID=642074 RepID=A0ABD0Y4Y5_9HEMI